MMQGRSRRAFRLAELLVALVLVGLVTAAAFRVLNTNQRFYAAASDRMNLQQGVRGAAVVLPTVLRQLDASEGDIRAMSATSLSVRAYRQLGFICDPPVLGGLLTARTMILRQTPFYGARPFDAATDSMFIFYDGDPEVRTDDGWMLSRVESVGTANCPDGTPGIRLQGSPSLNGLLNTVGAVPVGAPVWGFEPVTFKAHQVGSNWYLALQSTQGTQPLVQTTGSSGLTFTYRDSTGAVTATPANVAQIEVNLRAMSDRPTVQTGGGLAKSVDSLVMQISLRNNRRY
jgi:hypothetical protein